MSYDPRKAAQTIAYLMLKNQRQPLNIVKAVKLVYLADRESVRRHGFPIQDEPHYSLPHGPVNIRTYEFIKGEVPPDCSEDWRMFLTDLANHTIGLRDDALDVEDLDELSDADTDVLDAVWDQFGAMGPWQLRDWTHDPRNVPEWEDPNGSFRPIPLRQMMDAVGIDTAVEQAEMVEDSRASAQLLRAL